MLLYQIAGILFDGIAYGMLLFLMSVGLSVTLGMMNFTNLAHGAFARSPHQPRQHQIIADAGVGHAAGLA